MLSQIGAGFSFTDSDEGYSSNEDQIADNLYEYACILYQFGCIQHNSVIDIDVCSSFSWCLMITRKMIFILQER